MLARGGPGLMAARRSGAATRAYTFNDAPTRPAIWIDAQDSVVDGANRIVSVASKGTLSGSFLPPASTSAPLYDPLGYNGVLPGLRFAASRGDRLYTTLSGPAIGTAVYVWQEPAGARGGYPVLIDHKASGSGSGGRLTICTAYGGSNDIILQTTGGSSADFVYLNPGGDPPGKVNVLVLELNGGTPARAYLNGSTYSVTFPAGAVMSDVGICIGGKGSQTGESYDGVLNRLAIFPALFVNDDWNRLTQGTMWDARQQASIVAGAAYKNAQPTVSAA